MELPCISFRPNCLTAIKTAEKLEYCPPPKSLYRNETQRGHLPARGHSCLWPNASALAERPGWVPQADEVRPKQMGSVSLHGSRPLSFILRSGHRGDTCSWTSHGGRRRAPAGTEEGLAFQGYSPWVLVSLQTRCRPA